MKTFLHFFDRMSNFTSNLGLKFWLWALETIIHRFYSEGFWCNKKSYISRDLRFSNSGNISGHINCSQNCRLIANKARHFTFFATFLLSCLLFGSHPGLILRNQHHESMIQHLIPPHPNPPKNENKKSLIILFALANMKNGFSGEKI